ncbi:MAG: Lrp/AsnC family transcriptional regulator [Clostridia bacterium]|nr:Lrp/AsnC family transcriptional regulator [Clostridia bacterium]
MDLIDRKILHILANNSHTSSIEIGEKVGLSVPAVNKRIQKMQESAQIKHFTITTDPKSMEKPIVAYILLVIRFGNEVDKLLECVNEDCDILECYAVTGEYDYIIKVCASSIEKLEEKLLHLKRQKGVVKSHTMLSLMEHKFQPTVLPDIK